MRGLSLALAFCLWASAQDQVAPMLNLVVVEGEGAINNIRQRTARDPVVQVEDQNHRPVAGAVVTFTLPGHGASGVFANGAQTMTVTTDQQGQAIARGLRPNNVSGKVEIRVNANYRGQTANTVISQTNAVVAGAAGAAAGAAISGKLIAILAIVGAAVAGGAVYATHNGGSTTTAPTAFPATTVSAGAGTVGPPR